MSKKDLILTLLVAIIWGANFTVIKLGLEGVPSLLLVAIRFALTAFPAVFFLQRPNVPWSYWLAYGLFAGVGQFGCLFYAMEIGMPAGIASIVIQSQVFFTLILAALLLKETLRIEQIAGLLIATLGLYFISGARLGGNGESVPLGPFLLTLAGAFCFAIGNVVIRYAARHALSQRVNLNTFHLLIWSSLVPPLPLLALAFLLESPQTIFQALTNLTGQSLFAILYLILGATLFGYGTWNSLMAKYSTDKITPWALLVPVTGLLTAQIVLGEQLAKQQWLASLAIVFGLVVTNFGHLPLEYYRKSIHFNRQHQP